MRRNDLMGRLRHLYKRERDKDCEKYEDKTGNGFCMFSKGLMPKRGRMPYDSHDAAEYKIMEKQAGQCCAGHDGSGMQ